MTAMGNLLFWLGLGAAQKGAGSKPTVDRHWVVSFVVGILIAVLIAVGAFILLVSQQ
jgi:capsular polysaccharide biosynthesis protein